MAYLAEETANITGLSLFPQYLTLLFEIDGLILNDDRHLNNIAVLPKMVPLTTAPSLTKAQGCFPM